MKPAVFLRRYKRFFADVEFEGNVVTCHVPNTGSLKGCLEEGAPCLISISGDPKRKFPHTLELVQSGKTWVGVNTMAANAIVWRAWQAKAVPAWKEFDACQKEVRLHAKTRLDLAMWKGHPEFPATDKITLTHLTKHKLHFVEIKSVTMAYNGIAMFPDAVTTRGQKHLKEMIELKNQGHSAELVFLVQRNDCRAFTPADNIDPEYGKLLRQAIRAGVKVSAFPCEIAPEGIRLKANPLVLDI